MVYSDYILTESLNLPSHLCFESSNSKRNKVIKLADIMDIQKVSKDQLQSRSGTLWQPHNLITLI